MSKPTTNFISWIALFIAIVALFVSWDTSQKQANSVGVVGQIEEQINSSEGRVSLEGLNADVEQGLSLIASDIESSASVTPTEIAEQIAVLRFELQDEYDRVESDVQSSWQTIDADLAALERNFREGAESAIDNLQEYLERLENNISQ